MPRIRVCAIAELGPGSRRKLCSQTHDPIAVFNVGGRYYAIDDTCTHGKASLTLEGRVDGEVIECGWHRGRFSLVTGQVVRFPPARPLGVYAVVVEDGDIFVELADRDSEASRSATEED